jgi:hypothetical protein
VRARLRFVLFATFTGFYAFAQYPVAAGVWGALGLGAARAGGNVGWRVGALFVLLIEQRVPPAYAALVAVSAWAGRAGRLPASPGGVPSPAGAGGSGMPGALPGGNAAARLIRATDLLGAFLILLATLDFEHRFSGGGWLLVLAVAATLEFTRLAIALFARTARRRAMSAT